MSYETSGHLQDIPTGTKFWYNGNQYLKKSTDRVTGTISAEHLTTRRLHELPGYQIGHYKP